jgi:hypothetical protein
MKNFIFMSLLLSGTTVFSKTPPVNQIQINPTFPVNQILTIETVKREIIYQNNLPTNLEVKEGLLRLDNRILNIETINSQMIDVRSMPTISGGQGGGHG